MKKLSSKEISNYCESIAILLSSGVSVEDAVELVHSEGNGELSKAVLDNFELVISDAMEKTGFFPSYTIKMIETGEATGKTEEVLFGLADYYDKVKRYEKNISDLILYPSIVLAIVSAIMLFIVLRLLPVFRDVYENLSGYMEVNTSIYFNIAFSLGWIVFILSIGSCLLILLIWNNWKNKRAINDVMFLFRKFSRVERGIKETELAQFTEALFIYTESGVDPITAVENANEFIKHDKLKSKIEKCHERICNGERLSQAMKEEDIYSAVNRRLLFVAESSGKLTEGLKALTDKQWETADITLKETTESIEPLLSMTITVFVGLLLMSVMLPLISIMTSIC